MILLTLFKFPSTFRYKVGEFRSRSDQMHYAFEHVDVASTVEVLELQYSPKYPALPSELSGETFSRVFGTNQTSLEYFLISRKIKGITFVPVSIRLGPLKHVTLAQQFEFRRAPVIMAILRT